MKAKRTISKGPLGEPTTTIEGCVPDQRYGSTVKDEGLGLRERTLRRAHYKLARKTVFPESAIKADPSKQNYTVSPRPYYVDELKQCRDCGRQFIFFAREQQHWFEKLKFFIDADCVQCADCRKANKKLATSTKRYSAAASKNALTDPELEEFAADAIKLFKAGVIKTPEPLRKLKGQLRRRLPESPQTKLLAELLESLKFSRSS